MENLQILKNTKEKAWSLCLTFSVSANSQILVLKPSAQLSSPLIQSLGWIMLLSSFCKNGSKMWYHSWCRCYSTSRYHCTMAEPKEEQKSWPSVKVSQTWLQSGPWYMVCYIHESNICKTLPRCRVVISLPSKTLQCCIVVLMTFEHRSQQEEMKSDRKDATLFKR